MRSIRFLVSSFRILTVLMSLCLLGVVNATWAQQNVYINETVNGYNRVRIVNSVNQIDFNPEKMTLWSNTDTTRFDISAVKEMSLKEKDPWRAMAIPTKYLADFDFDIDFEEADKNRVSAENVVTDETSKYYDDFVGHTTWTKTVNIVFNGDVKSGKIVVEFSGISDGSLGDRFKNNTIRPKYRQDGRRMLLPRVIINGYGYHCTLNLDGYSLPIVLYDGEKCNVDLYQDEEYYDATMGFIPNTNAFFEGDSGYYGDAFVLYLNDVSSTNDEYDYEIFDYFYKNIPVNLYGVWSKMALHINFEMTSENSADVSICSSDYSTFEMETSIEILTDSESGDAVVVVGECPRGYGYFWRKKHHDLCGWFRDLLENCDSEMIKKLIGEPEVS